jgi:AcrR family transcriptional regulator
LESVKRDPTTSGTKGAQTRRAILDAAIARFGRQGFRSTSVADIARDASVGGTVTFNYFPSKEALFVAALDEDAAAVIQEGLSNVIEVPSITDWRQTLIFTLVDAVERHPLARRILAGLEPEITERVVDLPALAQLRKACVERLRSDQLSGSVRRDIDPVAIAGGVVAITISLLMSVLQFGATAADVYGNDVVAVIDAALAPPTPNGTG